MAKKLTKQQEGFAQDSLILDTLSDAYRKNYRCSKAKPETINRKAFGVSQLPHVAARIDELKAARCERTTIDADYVLQNLVDINEMDVLDILEDNGTIKSIRNWPKVWRRFVSGVDVSEMLGDAEGMMKKIKWPDKVKNLELIGKHVAVQAFKEKLDVEVGAKKSLQELMKLAAADG